MSTIILPNGGGKRHKKSKYLKKFLEDSQNHENLFYHLSFKKFRSFQNSKGIILIEFAFCISVIITLVFYAHDLYLLSRYYKQTQFVAEQMVSMIQNVSQNRIDKKITRNDLKNITALTYQTLYPGATMYCCSGSRKHVFGHFPHPIIYYVKGLENGNASCIWRMQMHTGYATNPATIDADIVYKDYDISAVRFKTDVAPSEIYPKLKIKSGEVKIIIDALIHYHGGSYWQCGLPPQKVFSLFLISPKIRNSSGKWNTDGGYFNSVIIFTPKTELFNETPPT